MSIFYIYNYIIILYTRNLLDRSSHIVISVKFVVNCLVVYGKSPWKVIVLSNMCKS